MLRRRDKTQQLRDIRSADASDGGFVGMLTGVVFITSVGDSIVNSSSVRRRFLPDSVEAYGVDILIDYSWFYGLKQ